MLREARVLYPDVNISIYYTCVFILTVHLSVNQINVERYYQLSSFMIKIMNYQFKGRLWTLKDLKENRKIPLQCSEVFENTSSASLVLLSLSHSTVNCIGGR